MDGPTGCDLAFFVVWFRFRLLRRYLALWPSQVGRAYRLLEVVGKGSPGHGPIHLLSARAAEIGFRWDPLALSWSRPGLHLLSNLAGPIQHLKAAILDAWRIKVSADLCGREGFRGGPLLDVHGSLQFLNSSHVMERDKALHRSVMVGGVWNGFLLGMVRGQPVPCRFCGARDSDGHLFGECTFPPLVEIRENPEFHDLMGMDKAHWPRCLLWHGWLLVLPGVNGASPWVADASENAVHLVEVALVRFSSGSVTEWSLPDGFDAVEIASRIPDGPDIWTDGSLVLDQVTGVSAAGAGFFAHQSEHCWSDRRWGHVDHVHLDHVVQSCGFASVLWPLQTVQRADLWGVILALQSSDAVHVGVDNLGVVRHVGRLSNGHHGSTPLELVTDGDLLVLIDRMLHPRGHDTVHITNFKGHADEGMVLDGRVRQLDKVGNDAADFGRRRVGHAVMDARRNLSGV